MKTEEHGLNLGSGWMHNHLNTKILGKKTDAKIQQRDGEVTKRLKESGNKYVIKTENDTQQFTRD